MVSICLIPAGSHDPAWLTRAAVEALRHADVVYCESGAWFSDIVARDGMRIEVSACRSACLRMMDDERAGQRVVRVYDRVGWKDRIVLRDMRMLRDASLAFELIPSTEPQADRWANWVEQRPLLGRRVVVLRMVGQASTTAELLVERGADPWVVPTIELHPPEDVEAFRTALRNLGGYDLVAFTSTNGVDKTWEQLRELGLDARAFGACRIAAIGDATARQLLNHGIVADVKAKEFRGEGLADGIIEQMGNLRGKRILIARAMEAREVLPEALQAAGADVDVVAAYRTLPAPPETMEPLREGLRHNEVDVVLLTSSSTVTNLCSALGQEAAMLLSRACLASIGPITTAQAKKLGLTVGVEAATFTVPGVVQALESYFR